MNSQPVATATARAEMASLRSMLTPTGTDTEPRTCSTARVIAATVSGCTRPVRKGESPKFSTMIPWAPPSWRIPASSLARFMTDFRLPFHLGDPRQRQQVHHPDE